MWSGLFGLVRRIKLLIQLKHFFYFRICDLHLPSTDHSQWISQCVHLFPQTQILDQKHLSFMFVDQGLTKSKQRKNFSVRSGKQGCFDSYSTRMRITGYHAGHIINRSYWDQGIRVKVHAVADFLTLEIVISRDRRSSASIRQMRFCWMLLLKYPRASSSFYNYSRVVGKDPPWSTQKSFPEGVWGSKP